MLAATMLGVACGAPNEASDGSPQPTASSVPAPPASSGPFEPMAWPLPGGGAPCGQGQPPDGEHAAYAGTLQRVKAIDPLTVEFRLCAPDIGFPTRLAAAAFAINDTGWLQSHIDPGTEGEPAIVREANGTGPYRLEAFDPGSQVTLARNDVYWGEAAVNERVVVRGEADADARFRELLDGSVDGADDLSADAFEAIESDVILQAIPRPGLNVFYAGFTNTFAPFDNLLVRRAIAMGIDRGAIVREHFPPGSEIASHFSPCAITDGCAGDAWYEFDAPAARQLLADAGFPDGFTTTIQYRDVPRVYLPDPTAVATTLQQQLLENLNITAELQVLPEDTFLATVDEGRADGIHLLGRIMTLPEIANVLNPHFGGGASREFGTPIEGLADLLASGTATLDSAARTAAYGEANSRIRQEVPMVPIAHAGTLTGYLADVEGAAASPVRYERFAQMRPGDRRQLVWLAEDAPQGLYCADETAPTAFLVCSQLAEGLFGFAPNTSTVVPVLAEGCEPSADLLLWRCSLRSGVSFHDGTTLDANDVVLSFAAQWDADHPLHRGREGAFQPFIDAFGGLLNPPR
jgi:ABC-type transport system substrate-binding protein